jgi:ketosteroid isomerase-like protein
MKSTQTGKADAVSAAVEALRKAMIAADKPALEKLAAMQLSYGHSSGRVENKAEFVEAFVSGKSGFSSIELEGQTINVVDNIALVRHVFNATHRNHRKDGNQAKLYILTVWQQQQDQWKLLARQATKL